MQNRVIESFDKKTKVLIKLTTELIFVLLPIVVLTIALTINSKFKEIGSSSEWSFAACVLFGQSIVKLGFGCVAAHKSVNGVLMTLIIAVLIVFGAIPSAVILAAMLNTENQGQTLFIIQGIWFFASVICYYWFGGIGEHKAAMEEG